MKTSCSFCINKQTAQSYTMDTKYLGVVVLSDYYYAIYYNYVCTNGGTVYTYLNDQYHIYLIVLDYRQLMRNNYVCSV